LSELLNQSEDDKLQVYYTEWLLVLEIFEFS